MLQCPPKAPAHFQHTLLCSDSYEHSKQTVLALKKIKIKLKPLKRHLSASPELQQRDGHFSGFITKSVTLTFIKCLLTHLVKVFFWTLSRSSVKRRQRQPLVSGSHAETQTTLKMTGRDRGIAGGASTDPREQRQLIQGMVWDGAVHEAPARPPGREMRVRTKYTGFFLVRITIFNESSVDDWDR